MQTFLPYPDFRASMLALDRRRLGKQRVEASQILKAIADPSYGWQHHPAVNMWRGYETALQLYYDTALEVFAERGGRNIKLQPIGVSGLVVMPTWLGWEKFHLAHRSNLVRKDAEYYGPLFPGVPNDLPYIWPTICLDSDGSV